MCLIADAVWEPATNAVLADSRFLEFLFQFLDPALVEPSEASPQV